MVFLYIKEHLTPELHFKVSKTPSRNNGYQLRLYVQFKQLKPLVIEVKMDIRKWLREECGFCRFPFWFRKDIKAAR